MKLLLSWGAAVRTVLAVLAVLAGIAGIAGIAGMAGCVAPSAVECDNGVVCPAGTTCVLLAEDDLTCATEEQMTACAGVADGESCTLASAAAASCISGACIPTVCGDHRVGPGEVCDDGNTVNGDGTCSADCQSNETCGNAIIDPLVFVNGEKRPNEQCDDGNLLSGDGCSSTCTNEVARWFRADGRLPALYGSRIAYDTARQRAVMFGGALAESGADNGDTFEWTGSQWVRIPTAVAPLGRRNHGMAYDAARRRVVLFGGQSGNEDDFPLIDTWTWDGLTWTQHEPAVSPPARTKFVMVYDGARKKVVLFGGYRFGAHLDDTWEWDGETWSEVTTPTRPPGRNGPVGAYDPVRGVIVIAGGEHDSESPFLDDTWELEGSTWRKTGTAPIGLDARATATWDPVGQRILVFGGYDEGPQGKTYEYTGSGWTELVDHPMPEVLGSVAVATDFVARKVILYGGLDADGRVGASTYLWTGAGWDEAPRPFLPEHRRVMASASDPERGVAWLYGGQDTDGVATNTLMSYDGEVWRDHTPATGGPSGRAGAGLAMDTKRKQLVMFGGATSFEDSGSLAAPETWVHDGTTWTQAATPTAPSPRAGTAMAYDPKRDRIVLFGGSSGVGNDTAMLDDTWEWDGTSWTERTHATRPRGRLVHSMVYDPVREVILLVGGLHFNDQAGTAAGELDVWAYDGTTWTQLVELSPWSSRIMAASAFDMSRGRLTLFGGRNLGNVLFSDTWSFDGADWSSEISFERPLGRQGHALFPTPNGPGLTMFGGAQGEESDAVKMADTWRFEYAGSPREVCAAGVDSDGDKLVGCDDPDCWYRCRPLCPPGTSCDPNAAPRCGDGVCGPVEDPRLCPADCPLASTVCGDAFCDPGETQASCPGDCTP